METSEKNVSNVERGKRRKMSRIEEAEIKKEKRGQGKTEQGGKPAAGMFHMPVLWMTWPPWSVGDTGSN